MKKLLYYNHNETNLPIKTVLQLVATQGGFFFHDVDPEARTSAFQELQDAAIVVIHGDMSVALSDGVPAYANYEWFCEKANVTADELVVLLVSSKPMHHQSKLVEFDIREGKTGIRFVFCVRDTTKSGLSVQKNSLVAQRKWTSLLDKCSPESLRNWFSNTNKSKSVPEFEELFEDEPNFEILTSLSILIQGYLAYEAIRYEREAVKSKTDVGNLWKQHGISDSLVKMGWASGENGLHKSAMIDKLEFASIERPEIMFWLECFDLERSDDLAKVEALRGKLMSEWNPNSQTTEPLPESVTKLLDSLCAPPDDFPRIVAAAFEDINRRLESPS